jgi:hypothetical protein
MTRTELIARLRRTRLAVEATVAAAGPQAAVVGIAVTDRLELIFDTVASSRKLQNLRRDPRIALVAWEGEWTLQIEGMADEPTGADGDRIRAAYLSAFPDGVERLTWPGITHVRIRPTWLRYSDFATAPPTILELDPASLT